MVVINFIVGLVAGNWVLLKIGTRIEKIGTRILEYVLGMDLFL